MSQILVCKIPVCRQLLNKSLRLKKPEKPESSRGKPAGLQGVLSVAFGTPRAHGTRGLLLPHRVLDGAVLDALSYCKGREERSGKEVVK